MAELNVKFETRFMLRGLRNVGYDAYTALDEYVDNSIDANSKDVFFDLIPNKEDKLITIAILDKGDGMTLEQLQEAFSFGIDSGKTGKDLGINGLGMKTAFLSMAKRLRVLTKTTDCSDIHYAEFDISKYEESSDEVPKIKVVEKLDEKDHWNKIFSMKSGTIILIDKFDKLPTNDIKTFKGTLISHLRLIYNKFIYDEMVNIFVCGEKLTFFDPIGYYNSPMDVKKMDEGIIEDEGIKARWIAYNIPKNDLYSKDRFPDFYGRTENKNGIYIYRCNRLVGQHLYFGMYSKNSHWHNGFRFELFLDGSTDTVFNTTFNKIIFEKDSSSIKKSFYDKLHKIVNTYANLCYADQKAKTKKGEVSEEEKKQLEDVTRSLNENPRIAVDLRKRGKNKPKQNKEEEEEEKEHKKQQNPNPTKRRRNLWFGGYEFERLGKTDAMYRFDVREGLHWLIINQDHEWYNQIFSTLDADAKNKIAAWVALGIVARNQVAYLDEQKKIDDDVVNSIFREYDDIYSDQVRKNFFDKD